MNTTLITYFRAVPAHDCGKLELTKAEEGLQLILGFTHFPSAASPQTTMSFSGESSNGLLCFTNCLLSQEDGCLVEKDLWIDTTRGVILDAQVSMLRVDVIAHS